MRVLIIAYEFPPVESAQGLRWGYMSRELARRGHKVRVVCARVHGHQSSFLPGPDVRVEFCFPGPFMALSGWLARIQGAGSRSEDRPGTAGAGLAGRAYRFVRRLLNAALVPDVRSEWLPWAWSRVKRVIHENRPDIVIASHEPGVDLAVARRVARKYGIPVMADLGDPMQACYSPRWRRPVDRFFERRWLAGADAATVTTEATRLMLLERVPHLRSIPVEVIPQGFDPEPAPIIEPGLRFSEDVLELLYTGTLYADFRRPDDLLALLDDLEGVRLTIIGHLEGFEERSLGAKVRFVGRMPHAAVRDAQRRADVLVNIANRDHVQVPGKIFEYLGANRPILHVSSGGLDPSAELLERLRCGHVFTANDPGATRSWLERRTRLGKHADQPRPVDGQVDILRYSWPELAGRLEALAQRVLAASEPTGADRHAHDPSH